MKNFALFASLLSLFVATAYAAKEVSWPNNGSIKVIAPKSPSHITIAVPGCVTVTIDWEDNSVQVTKHGESSSQPVGGSERLRDDGGELVVLLSRQENTTHVAVYAESVGGGFDSRLQSIEMPSCNISKLVISSPKNKNLKDFQVGVSKEIEQLYV
ncbi:uncharacterized protein LOC34619240 [Cyclospora cayetanensis]|uniref:Uncharacterized protein LOC34619240 n=1 Tax=Cyclospora cayetanensis TaxID=88456 RepID=A0A6P6RRB9_9EIME|nr:uncharacterized protein LOC34619240 [Cyclospora cayetanensis]